MGRQGRKIEDIGRQHSLQTMEQRFCTATPLDQGGKADLQTEQQENVFQIDVSITHIVAKPQVVDEIILEANELYSQPFVWYGSDGEPLAGRRRLELLERD